MKLWSKPEIINGNYVCLEPLSFSHLSDLQNVIEESQLDELWFTNIPKPLNLANEIERRLNLLDSGLMFPFAVIEPLNKTAVGMTTFMNVDSQNKRLEIGSTWYAKTVQKTKLNTECKLLLLSYAFEALECICVEFRTHFFNFSSRKSIERLGAKLDGILRSNSIMDNGTIRDTAVYSIIKNEWPTVKTHLTFLLNND